MFHVEHSGACVRWLKEGASELGFTLTDDHIAKLLTYLDELKRWNRKINLTAIRKDQEIIAKHFLDSIYCGQAVGLSEQSSVLDVGSGAGFPGIPIKIVNPHIELTLLEPSKKKIAFLQHITGTLRLDRVRALSKRLQDLPRTLDDTIPYTHVFVRALALNEVLPFAKHVLAKKALVILCRARPFGQRDGLDGLRIDREIDYRLPFRLGNRNLTILTIS